MRVLSYFLYLFHLLILLSCNSTSSKKSVEHADAKLFVQINDSSWSENIYKNEKVELELVNTDFQYNLLIKYKDTTINLDFKKANIPSKTPELRWVNKDFICVTTWWSASFSRCVFISFNKYKPYFYIDKSLELVDKRTNNIVYIDTIFQNKFNLKVFNLVTNSEIEIQIPKSNFNDEYPFYENIEIKDNCLLIKTSNKKYSFKL